MTRRPNVQQTVGTCPLCLTPNVALIESHVMPAWAYKRVRADGSAEPNPVKITPEVAVQTSKQVKQPLLCRPCDGVLLGPNDDLVSRLVVQKDLSAPFLQQLGTTVERAGVSWRLALPGSLDLAAICYFGSSVIWRASISRVVPNCQLGPYAEAFRQYLLGTAQFPSSAACLVFFHDNPPENTPYTLDRLFTMPISTRQDGFHQHEFMVCGLHYRLFVGGRIPEFARIVCVAHGTNKRVLLGAYEEIVPWLAPMFRSGKARGQLAKH